MAKTTKKTTKPVTMAERVRRIELDVNRHGANMAAITAAMREQLTSIAEEAMRASTMAHHARTNSRGNTVILNKIQNDLSLLLSGASFMQELEKAKPTEEQGLEPGDYTDASKEVADELTAMNMPMFSSDSLKFRLVTWDNSSIQGYGGGNVNHFTQRSPHEFLSRARVTAKRLGLVPVEQLKPWKPEVGELVVIAENSMFFKAGHCGKVLRVDKDGDVWLYCHNHPHGACVTGRKVRCVTGRKVRPATPEEVAKYHADQAAAVEAAKPMVPYVTRVMYDGEEWRVIQVVERTTHPYGLHSAKHGIDWVARDWFKVID